MNRFSHLPATRWNFSPVSNVQDALDCLQQAQAFGDRCESCNKFMLNRVVFNDAKKYHPECWIPSEVLQEPRLTDEQLTQMGKDEYENHQKSV